MGAEVRAQRCRGAEVQRCRGAEVQVAQRRAGQVRAGGEGGAWARAVRGCGSKG